jgi:hypothetical protein
MAPTLAEAADRAAYVVTGSPDAVQVVDRRSG